MAALSLLVAACDTSRTIADTTQSSDGCTRCHGYPPPPYATSTGANHPQSANDVPLDCNACHPGTVEADNVTIVPGGLHMNGVVDVVGAGHPTPYVADHAPAALANIASCKGCHGPDYGGGSTGVSCNDCHATNTTTYPALAPGFPDWKTNCTFCHGTRTASVTTATARAAPPVAVDRSTTAAKVGAHQAHLAQGPYANALPCTSCHAQVTGAQALTHFDGGAAAITFSALATQGVASPGYAGSGGTCAVYCHGSGNNVSGGSNPTPAWTATGLACSACHTTSPTSGEHTRHLNAGVACSRCHPGYQVGSPGTVDRTRHMNGTLEAEPSNAGGTVFSAWPGSCNSCH